MTVLVYFWRDFVTFWLGSYLLKMLMLARKNFFATMRLVIKQGAKSESKKCV